MSEIRRHSGNNIPYHTSNYFRSGMLKHKIASLVGLFINFALREKGKRMKMAGAFPLLKIEIKPVVRVVCNFPMTWTVYFNLKKQ